MENITENLTADTQFAVQANRCARQRGISLVEVMVSTGFLAVTLMGVALTMTTAIVSANVSQEQLLAKQKAREAMESVFTARNTQNITFAQIQNVANAGIFADGFQALRETGLDGIANTADDAAANVETVSLPGLDGVIGTGDDRVRDLSTSFDRRITISDVLLPNNTVDPDIRQVQVQVRYTFRGTTRTVTLTSRIARFG